MTCQIHATKCLYDFDADRRRLNNPTPILTDVRRNPSRQYIESLEARVGVLESILKAVRDADSNSLPEIISELRSNDEELSAYAPYGTDNHEEVRGGRWAGCPNEPAGNPLVELGKIMGTMQLDDGEVHFPQDITEPRYATSVLRQIYHSSPHQANLKSRNRTPHSHVTILRPTNSSSTRRW
jgi:hypothetical protein